MALKRIENYSNYREFLKEFYDHSKKTNKYFSYRYFCQKAGLQSPTILKEVTEGRRNLTENTLRAFIKGLKLSELDGRFFSALVKFNQAKSESEKKEYLEQMRGLLPDVKEKTVPVAYYAYYSNWYNIALRELACVVDWKNNFQLLGKMIQPSISKKQVQSSIELLLELGFLKMNSKGGYVQTHPHIKTGSEISSVAVRNVNYQLSKLGMDSLQNVTPDQRDISSLTLGVSRETYSLCKREIQDFKKRVKRIVEKDKKSDRVYNLNIQLFPLSKPYSMVGEVR